MFQFSRAWRQSFVLEVSDLLLFTNVFNFRQLGIDIF